MAASQYDPLASSRVADLPDMYYISDFLTPEEEATVLHHIPPNRWVNLAHRRLQAIPAPLTASNTLVSNTDLPQWLTKPICERFAELGIFKASPHGCANHCLINEYLPGQGIMPHEDGPAYHPVVATVSLSGSSVLQVYEKRAPDVSRDANEGDEHARKVWRVLQEPRSLLVTSGPAYTDTLHGIAENTEDTNLNKATVANWDLLQEGSRQTIVDRGGTSQRATRISLTFRDVLKISKLATTIFGKPKR